MSAFLAVLAAVLVLIVMLTGFMRIDAARLASAMRTSGPLALGAIGLAVLFTGRAGIGGMMLSGAAAWYASMRSRQPPSMPSPGMRSTVRTAALEMELNHDDGSLEGTVLAGRHEGKTLGAMGFQELRELYSELSTDSESRQLLETYLDGRFPVWRADAKANGGDGHGIAPGSGAMTKEEAYKVLGLETGATTADIRQAHRRLMQRLHPDIGGTSFLAARINEAKDVLLSNHG